MKNALLSPASRSNRPVSASTSPRRPSIQLRGASGWLRGLLALAQIMSALSAAVIGVVQPQFAPLVGDSLGPWGRQAAEAVDAMIGAPNEAFAAVTCTTPQPVTNGTFAGNLTGWTVNQGWQLQSGSLAANFNNSANNDTLTQNIAEVSPSSLLNFSLGWDEGNSGAGRGNTARLQVSYGGVTYGEFTTVPFGTTGNATFSVQGGATLVTGFFSIPRNPAQTGNINYVLQLPAGIANTGALTFRMDILTPGDPTNAGDDYFIDNVSVSTTRLCLRKQTVGGTGTFNFTTTNVDNSHTTAGTQTTAAITPPAANAFEAFDASTAAGSQASLIVNEAAAVTVAETVPAGWDVSGTCFDNTSGTVVGTINTAGSVTIPAASILAGGTYYCNYINTRQATITIIKNAVPDNAQDFAFTGSGTIGAFSLDDDADGTLPSTRSFGVVPGAYTVVEAGVAGWDLTGVSCIDPGTNSNGSTATRTASINAAAGETVSCTFVNTQLQTFSADGTCSAFAYQSIAPASAATDLFQINLATGQSANLNPASSLLGNEQINAIGFSEIDNLMYGYNRTTSQIARIQNTAPPSAISLGAVTNLPASPFNGGDVRNGYLYLYAANEARFYVVDVNPTRATYLRMVEPTALATVDVAPFGQALNGGAGLGISDWAFASTGFIYAAVDQGAATDVGRIYRIDSATGVATDLGIPTGPASAQFSTVGIGPYGAVFFSPSTLNPPGYIYFGANATPGLIFRYNIAADTVENFSQLGFATGGNDGARCASAPINLDFGDAPDTYGTTLATNGARHLLSGTVASSALRLGVVIDGEDNGQPNGTATGDDIAGIPNDEDGVTLPAAVGLGQTLGVPVVVSGTGLLNAWIDWNVDGDFLDAGEQIATNVAASTGTTTLNVTVPSNATPGTSYARFRFSTQTGLTPLGGAPDGEVEDYTLNIVRPVLTATKTAAPSLIRAGDPVTYTIRVTNTSAVTATNVQVSDTLPSPLSFVSATSSIAGVSYVTPTFTPVFTLAAGGTATFTLVGLVPTSVISGTSITNTAVVTSPNSLPVTPTVTITPGVPVLVITKLSNVVTTTAGGQVQFTVLITNASNVTATNVNISDTAPTGMSLIGPVTYTNFAGPTTGICTQIAGRNFTCPLGTVPAGGTAQITATYGVTIALLGPITNTAVVTSPNTLPVTGVVTVSVFASCSAIYGMFTGALSVFNPSTGLNLPLGNVPNGSATLAVSPDGRYLFYVGNAPADLNVFDTQTGLSTATGVVPAATVRLAFDAAGRLWSYTGANTLQQITVTNPFAPVVGTPVALTNAPGNAVSVAAVSGGDIAFAADGTGYVIDVIGRFFRFNVNTRVATYINTVAGIPNTTGSLAFDSNGLLYAGNQTGSSSIYVINPATGVGTPVPNTSLFLRDSASCAFPPVTPDVRIAKTNTPVGSVVAGVLITYTIEISNVGNLIDTNVTFSDTVPANTTFVAGSLLVTARNGAAVLNTVTQTGTTIRGQISSAGQSIGTLVAGSVPTNTVLITFAVTVNSGYSGTLTNTASFTSTTIPTPTLSAVTNSVQLAALVASKSAVPSLIRPGDTVTYSVQVTNTSDITATGIIVSDNLPSFLQFVSAASSIAGQTYVTPSFTPPFALGANGVATFTLVALVPTSVTSGTAIVNTAVVSSPNSLPVTPTVTITPQAPTLTSMKTVTPTGVRPGDVVTYTIRVTNTSNVTATNVVVSDSLPSPLVLQDNSASQGSYVTPTWTVGQINPGASAILTLTALIPTSVASGTAILNMAVVSNPNSPLVTSTVTITPVVPTLNIDKRVNVQTGTPGDAVVYTLRVTNTSPYKVTAAAISDDLPSALLPVSASCEIIIGGSACTLPTITGQLVEASVDLDVGAVAELVITGTIQNYDTIIDDYVISGTQIINVASVTPPGEPPTSTQPVTVTVIVTPMVDVSKIASVQTGVPGSQVVYTIRITNTTTTAVTNAPVSDLVPDQITVLTASCSIVQPVGGCSVPTITGQLVEANVNLNLNAVAELVITGVIDGNVVSGTQIVNTAVVSVPGGVPTTTPPVTVTVITTPALQISKFASPSVIYPGDQIIYTIIVTSTGNTTATNVADAVILDDLPAGVTLNAASCAVTVGTCVVNPVPTDPVTAVVNLPGNSVGVATVTITATASSALISGTTLINTAVVTVPGAPVTRTPPVTVSVIATPTVAVSKVVNVQTGIPGSQVVYTIQLRNTGNTTVTGAILNDVVPSEMTPNTATCSLVIGGSACATPVIAGQLVSTSVDLDLGSVAELVITGTIDGNVISGTQIVNTAVVSVPGGVPTTTLPVTVTVITTPALQISKFASPSVIYPGDQIIYTIIVTSTGNTTATNVADAVILDDLPGGVTLNAVLCSVTVGTCVVNATPTDPVTAVVNLPGNSVGVATVTITGTASTSLISGTALINTAVVTVPGVPVTRTPPVTVSVIATPTVAVSKVVNVETGIPGSQVVYTIQLRNTGNTTVTGAALSDLVPSEVTPNTASCAIVLGGSNCEVPVIAGQFVSTSVDLDLNSIAELVITGTIDGNVISGTQIVNTAVVTVPGQPPTTTPPVTVTVITTPALQISKSASPSVVYPGDQIIYTIIVTSTGNTTATNVADAVILDDLPGGVTLNTASCAVTVGTCVVNPVPTDPVTAVVNLPGNSVGVATVTITATASSALISGTTLINTAVVTVPGVPVTRTPPVTVSVIATPTVAVSKVVNVQTGIPGSQVVYRVQLRNTGNTTVTGAALSDLVPSEVTPNMATCSLVIGGSSCDTPVIAGQLVSTSVDLDLNSIAELVITGTIDGNVVSGTQIVNTAVVTVPGGVPTTTPPVTVTVIATPALQVSKSASPSIIYPGDQIIYTIIVTSTGNTTATNVADAVILDDLPVGVTLNAASCAVSVGTCVVNPVPTDPVTAVVNLPGNSVGVATVTITATASSALISGTTLINTAVVTVPGVPVTRTPPVTVSVIATPTVVVSKVVNVQTGIPGSQVVYTIQLRNTGNTTVTGAALSDLVPSEVTPNTATCSLVIGGSSCDTPVIAGQLVSTSVDLDLNSIAELVITGTIDGNVISGTQIVNTAVVTVPGQPPTTTPPVTVTVIATPALQISKSASPSVIYPGDQIIYTIIVTSTGNTTATNVADAVILDDLPGGVTLNAVLCSVTVGTCVVNPVPTDPVTAVVNLPGNSVGVATVTITGTASTSLISGTTLINTAVVTVPGVPVTRTPPVTVSVIATPTVAASKVVNVQTGIPGSQVVYRVQLRNTGNTTVTGAALSDLVPSEVTPNTASCAIVLGGSNCEVPVIAGQFVSTSVDLDLNSIAELVITGTIDGNVISGTQIVNTAVVSVPGQPPTTTPPVTVTVITTPALQISKSASPSVVYPGDQIIYTIIVTSTGNTTATNVADAVILDDLPGGVTLNTASCAVSVGTCIVNPVPTDPVTAVVNLPGDSVGVATVTITGTASTSLISGTTLINTAVVTVPGVPVTRTPPVTVSVIATPTVAVLKIADVQSTTPGGQVVYTIRITNTGNTTVTNSVLNDVMPSTVTPNTATCVIVIGGSTCATPVISGQFVSTTVNLNLNSIAELVITGTVDGNVISGTAIANTAVVTVPGGVPTTTLPVTVTVIATPALQISKSASPSVVYPGDQIIYTIVVTSTGNTTATNVADAVILDDLPGGVTLNAVLCSVTVGTCVVNPVPTDPVTAVVNLPGNSVGVAMVTITGTASTSLISGTTLLNTAVVTVPGAPVTRTPPVSVTVIATPTVAVSKIADVQSTIPGGQVVYTIRVTNTGNTTVTGAILNDLVPSEVTPNTASCAIVIGGSACAMPVIAGQLVSTSVDLDLSSVAELIITGTIDGNVISGTQIVNTAVVSVPGQPPTTTPPVTVTVITTPALQISKSASPSVIYPGDQIIYTIIVTSTGNTTATNVADAVILDDLPAGVTLSSASCAVTIGSCVVNPVPIDPVTAVVNLPGNSVGVATVTITGTASGSLISGTTLINTAVVTVPGVPVTRTPPVTVSVIATPTVAVSKVVNVETGIPGSQVVYTIQLRNTGNTTVTGAALSDLVPSEVTPNTATCAIVLGGSNCEVPVIAGQFVSTSVDLDLSSVAELIITGTIDGNVISGTQIVNTAVVRVPGQPPTTTPPVTVTVIATPALQISKSASPSVVYPGDQIIYTIIVTSTGNTTATNVADAVILDDLPGGVTLNAASCAVTVGTCVVNPVPTDPVTAVVNLPGNSVGVAMVTITGTASTSLISGTTLINTAVVTVPGVPVTRTPPVTVSVIATPTVAASKVVNVQTGIPGSQVVYTIQLRNTGNTTVTGAILNDVVPSEVTPGTATCSLVIGGSNCDTPVIIGQLVSTSVDLNLGSVAELVITGTIDGNVISGTQIVNTAVVTVQGQPPTTTPPVTVTVITTPALQISKSASPSVIYPGDQIIYTIIVTSTGNTTATNVADAVILDDLPGGVTLSSASCAVTIGSCVVNPVPIDPVTAVVNLPGNSVGVATVTITGTASGSLISGTTLINTAVVTVPGAPVTRTPPVTVSVIATPTVAVSKVVNVETGIPGSQVVYTIQLRNTGNTTVTGAALSDLVPSEVTPNTATCAIVLGGSNCEVPVIAGQLVSTSVDLDLSSVAELIITGTIDGNVISGTQIVNTAVVRVPGQPPTTTPPVTVTVIATPALQISKSASPSVVYPGDQIIYTIIVTSTGNTTATNVADAVILDDLPGGVTLNAASCAVTVGTCVVNPVPTDPVTAVVNLPGNSVGVAMVTITGTASGSLISGTTLINTAVVTVPGVPVTRTPPVSVTVIATPTVAVLKIADVQSTTPGGQVVYTIRITNTGNTTVTNAVLNDVVPSMVTPNTAACSIISGSGLSCATPVISGQLVSTTVNLDLGSIAELVITGTVDGNVISGTAIANTAVVTVPGGVPTTTPPVTVTVIATPALQVSKSANPSQVYPGAVIVYTIIVTSTGNTTATNAADAVILDDLPAGVTLNSASCAVSVGTCLVNPTPVDPVTAVVNLPGNSVGVATVTITATASTSLISGTVLLNTAVVTVPGVPVTRTPPVTVTVIATPSVSVSKLADVQSTTPGGQVVYTIRITNTGNTTVTNAVLNDVMPSTVTPNTATCVIVIGGSTCATPVISGQFVSTTVNLNLNSIAELVITGTVDGNVISGTAIANTAVVTVPGGVPTTTPPVTVTVIATPALQVSKSASPSQVYPGALIVYTIQVTSTGNTTATNAADAVILDDLPAGVTLNAASCVVTVGTCVVNPTPTDPVTAVVNLPGNSVGVATVTITATASSSLISGTVLLNTAVVTVPGVPVTRTPPVSVTVIATPTVAVSKIADVQSTTPGGQVVYTIRITNTGNTTVTAASLSDLVPNTVTPNTATCSIVSGSGLSCATPVIIGQLVSTSVNLDLNAVAALVITGTVDGSVISGTAIANTAVVTVPGGVPTTTPPVMVTVIATPALQISKSASPSVIYPGDQIIYTIIVTSTGNTTATNVADAVILDDLPAGVTLNAASCSVTVGTCVVNPVPTDPVTAVVNLPGNSLGVAMVTITGTASTSLISGTTLINTAVVTVPGVPMTRTPPVTVSVIATPTVAVLKIADVQATIPGGQVVYTIQLRNTGNTTVTGAALSDLVPSEVTPNTATCSLVIGGSNCDTPVIIGQFVSTSVDLNLGSVAELVITGTIDGNVISGTQIVNTAVVSVPGQPPTTTPPVTVTVITTPALQISKFASPSVIYPGDQIIYTIIVTSTGNTTATNVADAVILDDLPGGVTLNAVSCVVTVGTCAVNPTPTDPVTAVVNLPGNSVGVATVTITGTASTSLISGTTLINTAVVTVPGVPVTRTPPVTVSVIATPTVAVSKVVNVQTGIPGSQVVYRVQLRNTGNTTVTGAALSDLVPSEVTPNTASCAIILGESSCEVPVIAGQLVSTSVDLDLGSIAELVITGTIDGNVVSGTQIVNTAVVTVSGQPPTTTPPVTVTVTVSTTPALQVSKSASPSVIYPGDQIIYTIVVTSTGNTTATNVADAVILDDLPVGVTLNAASCAVSVGTCVVNSVPTDPVTAVVNLPGNSLGVATVTITGTASTSLISGTTLINTAVVTVPGVPVTRTPPVTVNVIATPTVAVSKVVNVQTGTPGSQVVYRVQLRNTGNTTVTGAILNDVVPSEVTPNTATCSLVIGGSSCEVPMIAGQLVSTSMDLDLGSVAELVITGTIDGNVMSGTQIVNTAVVRVPGQPPTTTPPVTVTVIATPALQISKSASPSVIYPGDQIIYTIIVTSTGNTTATNVADAVIFDDVPDGVMLNAASCAVMLGTCEVNPTPTDPVTAAVDLPGNSLGVATVTITGTASTSLISGTTLINTAVVTVPGAPVTRTPPVTVNVIATPTVAVSKIADVQSTIPGGQVVYTIRITNTGNTTVTNAAVSDLVPAEVTPNASSCAIVLGSGICTVPTVAGQLVQTSVSLNLGSVARLVITGTLSSALISGTQLLNTAVVTTPGGVPTNTPPVTITVIATPTVMVSKLASTATAQSGEAVIYTIRITNTGNTTVTNALVSDWVPTGVTPNAATCSLISGSGLICQTPTINGQRVGTAVTLNLTSVAQLVITGTVDGNVLSGTQLVNTAVVTTPGGVPTTTPPVTITVVATPTLAVVKSVNRATVFPGDELVYTIRITNTGNTTVTGAPIAVSDLVPAQLTGLTASCVIVVGGSTCATPTINGQLVQSQVTLTLNGAAQLVITGTVSGAVISGTQWGNTAVVTAPGGPPTTTPPVTVMVIATPSVAVSKLASTATSRPEDEVGYTIRITNTGNTTVTNMPVSDLMPIGVTPNGTSCNFVIGGGTCPTPTINGQLVGTAVTLNLGSVVQLVILGTLDSNVISGTQLGNTAVVTVPGGVLTTTPPVTITVIVTPSVAVSKIASTATSRPGGTVVYTIRITNTGNTTVTNAIVSDLVPTTVTPNAATCRFVAGGGAGGGVCTVPTLVGQLVQASVSLNLASVAELVITGTVNSNVISGTAIVNTAVVTVPGQLPRTTSPITTTTVATPSVSISKLVNRSLAQPGDTVIYTVPFTNTGLTTLVRLVLVDPVPVALLISSTACVVVNAGGTGASRCAVPTVVGNQVSTTFDLDPGVAALLIITSTVRGEVVGGTVISNTAFVGPDPALGLPGVSSPPVSVTLVMPRLRLVKTVNIDNKPQVMVGDILTYTIVVTNEGGGVAYNVVITDPIPSAMSYVAGSAQPAGTFSNNTLRWTVPSLAPGQAMAFTFRLKLEFVGERGAVFNVGYVSADGSSTPIPNSPPVTANDDAGVAVTPTAVTLVIFKAVWAGQAVNVMWETGSEINTFGFALYRSVTERRQDAVLVTPALIRSKSVNNGGAGYAFEDATATPGVTYTYWLAETETTGKINEYGPVNTAGLEIHGPAIQRLFLPVMMR